MQERTGPFDPKALKRGLKRADWSENFWKFSTHFSEQTTLSSCSNELRGLQKNKNAWQVCPWSFNPIGYLPVRNARHEARRRFSFLWLLRLHVVLVCHVLHLYLDDPEIISEWQNLELETDKTHGPCDFCCSVHCCISFTNLSGGSLHFESLGLFSF